MLQHRASLLEEGVANSTKSQEATLKQQEKLSYTAVTFLVFLSSLALWTWATDTPQWSSFELLLLTTHPAALLYLYRYLKCQTFVPLDGAVRVFAAGFLPGALLAASWEHTTKAVLSRAFATSNEEVHFFTHRSLLSKIMFLVLMSYGTTSLVEELFKLSVARSKSAAWCFWVRPPTDEAREQTTPRVLALATMILTTAGAAGFAMVENVVYFGIPCRLIGACSPDQPHVAAETLLFRTLVPATLHILCGIVTGVSLARREAKKQKCRSMMSVLVVILPAVLVHGTYDLFINLFTARSAVWLVGMAAICMACAVLAWNIRGLRQDLRERNVQIRNEASRRTTNTLMKKRTLRRMSVV